MENLQEASPTTWIIHLSLVSPDNHKINTFLSCLAQGVNLEAALQELRTTLRNLYFEGNEYRNSLPSGASIYLHQAVEMGEMNKEASCLFIGGTIDMKTAGIDIPEYEGDLISHFCAPEPNIPDGLKRESPCAIRDSSGKIVRFTPFLVLPDLR
jgi:hypothetical protein